MTDFRLNLSVIKNLLREGKVIAAYEEIQNLQKQLTELLEKK